MIIFYSIAFLSFLIILIYSLIINKFIKGWDNTPYFKANGLNPSTPITIITACKNEITQLPHLFKAIKDQSYPNFEMILVDDHSTDGSYEYCQEVALGFPELKVVKNEGKGKKYAVKTGVYLSENELIVTLDADSFPGENWLLTIVQFYENTPSDLIICPVRMTSDGSFLQDFQQFEFTSLVGSGAGAAGAGMPIFCNGANLAFRKEAWLASEHELNFDEPSGDDIYLLQSIKRRNGAIRFLKSTDAMVSTNPPQNLKSYLRQRKRWASKLSAYKDRHFGTTGLIVFLSSFSIVLLFLISPFKPLFLSVLFLVYLLKWIVAFSFFQACRTFYSLKHVIVKSLIFSIIYPFYVVIAASNTFLRKKNKDW